jgi:hypothetical protein
MRYADTHAPPPQIDEAALVALLEPTGELAASTASPRLRGFL